MTIRIAGLVGSFGQSSRTRALVELVAKTAVERFDGITAIYDLDDLQPGLAEARRLEDLAPLSRSILESVLSADVLVIGSPVYKGSYPGLFKHLIDLIEPEALRGKPVLLTATGGGERHALMIEHQLRPLFGFFEAATLPTGLYASAAEFAIDRPPSPGFLARLDRAVAQIQPFAQKGPAPLTVAA